MNPIDRMCIAAIALPVKIGATYFTLYLLERHFYNGKRKPINFFLYLLASMVVAGLVQRMVSYNIVYPLFYQPGLSRALLYLPKIAIEAFGVYSVVAIVIVIHLINKWYLSEQERQQLKHEKLEAELKYLKAQIHPHFLFNTLNNLYSLTITNSKKAPEIVYKLSQLMSYMLYDSNKPFVPLQKEIDYIENYITLEKIRYADRLDVSLNILNNIDHIQIAPLLILPFIENSFKHGVANDIGKVWVHINILVSDGQLIIKVENSKAMSEDSAVPESGIGLSNVKKRLALIYKDRYSLQLLDEETYLVILKLKL
jgi:LytS/YehU family sensor histidine kinase